MAPSAALGALAAELRTLQGRAARLQAAISPAVPALSGLDWGAAACLSRSLQDLDAITQSLGGLAVFAESSALGGGGVVPRLHGCGAGAQAGEVELL